MLNKAPVRICALAFSDELLALGIKPIAAAARNGSFPDYLTKQLQEATPINQLLEIAEPDFESLIDCRPDLILAADITGQTYDRLSMIAPTIVMSSDGEHNRQRMLDLGRLLDRYTQAETYLKEYDQILRQARVDLLSKIGNGRVAFFRIWGKQFYIHGHSRGGILLYDELGLTPPSLIETHERGYGLSAESILQLDADVVFVATESNRGAEQSWRTLLTHPVWQRVPAVKSGNVFVLSEQHHWLRQGFQAKQLMLEEILSALAPSCKSLDELRRLRNAWMDN